MRKLCFAAAGLLAMAGLATLLVPAHLSADWTKSKDKLVVHEWGTFLTVQGSDGVTMGGMVDSEETLPRFVRERSLDGYSRASMFSKMETPVTYFYAQKPMTVNVQVSMPRGLLTHWFPTVSAFGPPRKEKQTGKEDKAIGSFLDWGQLTIVPDNRTNPTSLGGRPSVVGEPELFGVGKDDTWKFARETDAALVKFKFGSRERAEKFLFYRGLGTFDLPLEIRSSGADNELTLSMKNKAAGHLEGLFAIWVKNGTIRFGGLDNLDGNAVRDVAVNSALTNHLHLADGLPKVKEAVADSLVKAGLYRKEALAMVNTWEKSYFQNEGLRVLYILPRDDVDQAIPIRITPEPEELERVMVGRVEILTPETEKRIEAALSKMDDKNAAVSQGAVAELDRLGRLKEPVLRRISVMTKAAEVKAKADSIVAGLAKK